MPPYKEVAMGIKTFLKRFVAAFGDAAHASNCPKIRGPPVDLSNCDFRSSLLRLDVNPISCDYNTFPAGYNGHLTLILMRPS